MEEKCLHVHFDGHIPATLFITLCGGYNWYLWLLIHFGERLPHGMTKTWEKREIITMSTW